MSIVWENADMWPHFVNLLARSGSALVSALGTTTLAICVAFVGFLFILFLNLVFKMRKDGWKWSVMMSHFSQNLKDSLLPTVIGTFILWTALFAWFTVRTVFTDHMDLAAHNGSLARENSKLTNTNSHLVNPKSRDDEIKELKGQIKALTPTTKLRIQTRFYTMEDTAQLNGKSGRLFLVGGLTNKPITPVDVKLLCDQDIVALNAPSLGIGGAYQNVGFEQLNSKSLRLKIGSPAWMPDTPLGIPIFAEAGTVRCELKQENE